MNKTLESVRANKGQFKKGHTVRSPIGEKHSQYRHGYGGREPHPLYVKWNGIKRRCYNPNTKGYSRYGGAGIKMSDEWLDFENFRKDMEPTWFEGATIDRIDNSLGYSKENCRWATVIEQARNKSSVRKIPYKGKMLSIGEIALDTGIKHRTLYARIRRFEKNGKPLDFLDSILSN